MLDSLVSLRVELIASHMRDLAALIDKFLYST